MHCIMCIQKPVMQLKGMVVLVGIGGALLLFVIVC